MTAIEIYLDKTLRERWSFVKRRVSLDLVKHIIEKYQDGPIFRAETQSEPEGDRGCDGDA